MAGRAQPDNVQPVFSLVTEMVMRLHLRIPAPDTRLLDDFPGSYRLAHSIVCRHLFGIAHAVPDIDRSPTCRIFPLPLRSLFPVRFRVPSVPFPRSGGRLSQIDFSILLSPDLVRRIRAIAAIDLNAVACRPILVERLYRQIASALRTCFRGRMVVHMSPLQTCVDQPDVHSIAAASFYHFGSPYAA
jgi:hypothetical protein